MAKHRVSKETVRKLVQEVQQRHGVSFEEAGELFVEALKRETKTLRYQREGYSEAVAKLLADLDAAME